MADEIRKRTGYETYRGIVDRAFQLGEFGQGQQTPFHRLAAAGVSMLPTIESLRSAMEFLAQPDQLANETRQAAGTGPYHMPDLHAIIQNPQVQNMAIAGAAGKWLLGDDIAAMRQPELPPRFFPQSPRHTPGRGMHPRTQGYGDGEKYGWAARRGAASPEVQPLEDNPFATPELPDETAGGGLGLAEPHFTPPSDAALELIHGLTDTQLSGYMDLVRNQMNHFETGTPQWLMRRELHRAALDEARRRSGPEFAPPGTTPNYIGPSHQLPPHNRLPSDNPMDRLNDSWVDQQLARASERVRARQRAHDKKAAELQAPAEEGKKLGPLPPLGEDAQLSMDIGRIAAMTDMEVMALAATPLQGRYFNLARRELKRRGIIPPGTKF